LVTASGILSIDRQISAQVLGVATGRRTNAVPEAQAQIWDAATGAPIGELIHHPKFPLFPGTHSVAVFSADGKRIVTGEGSDAQVWDAITGAPIGRAWESNSSVTGSALSPDGLRVATALASGTAQIWDTATGVLICKPLRHEGVVRSATFSPDGGRVVTASDDKTAQVWDAATGEAIGQPLQHAGSVNGAWFSPDGERVATASSDGTARVWIAPPVASNIVATACKMLLDQDTSGLSARYRIDVKEPI
jgi:WD40 repeat protein